VTLRALGRRSGQARCNDFIGGMPTRGQSVLSQKEGRKPAIVRKDGLLKKRRLTHNFLIGYVDRSPAAPQLAEINNFCYCINPPVEFYSLLSYTA
jgi:hypothetical protein